MKKLSIGILLISGICLFSCNGDNSTNESTSTASDTTVTGNSDTSDSTRMSNAAMDTTNTNAGNQMVDQKTKDFVTEAATGGMMEVELGNLAQQKATSQQVKEFGKMMVDDHSKANDNLKDIASKKNIDLPASITDEERKDIDKLSKKSGADFDKSYVDMMVKGHKKTIDVFKKASADVGDNDVKSFAANTLPAIQKHLEAIQSIKSKM